MWKVRAVRPNSGLRMSSWLLRMGFAHTKYTSLPKSSGRTVKPFWRHGMSTLAAMHDPVALGVSFSDYSVTFDLADGRSISAPLEWFPRLLGASPQQRANWRLIGRGAGVHWPDVDEDISIPGLMGLPD